VLRALTALLFLAHVAAAGPLDARDKALREGIAAELVRLAATLERDGGFEEAAEELRLGLYLVPGSEPARRAMAALAGKRGRGAGEELRRKAHEAIAERLEGFAEEAAAEQDLERAWRAWTDARILAPSGSSRPWFAAYGLVVREEDRERLEAGEEFVDGRWLAREEVARQNERHAAWTDPWVLVCDGYEVRTTMPLRTARQVAWHAAAFRRHLLAQIAGEWDLRAPAGRLPIYVAGTQRDFQALAEEQGGPGATGDPQGAAFYLWSSRPLNPCLVTFEPIDVGTGLPLSVGFDQLVFTLRHELAHQLLFEYSRHGAPRPRPVDRHFWLVEGLAEFFTNFTLSADGWRLAYPRRVAAGSGYFEGNLAYCQEPLASLPALEAFFATPKSDFKTMEHYHQGAAVCAFLWQSPRWRGPFLKLAEAIHQSRPPPSWLEAARMQAEWEAFVAELPIEGEPGRK